MTHICAQPGCTRGRETGHALHRTSPRGELFEGKCAEHFKGEPDQVAQIIEDHNHAKFAKKGNKR